MSQILTQDEIDALINGMAGIDEPAKVEDTSTKLSAESIAISPVAEDIKAVDIHQLIKSAQKDAIVKPEPKKDYKLYDFRRPEKFSKNQARDIKSQIEMMIRQLNNLIANMMRFETEVVVLEVGQCNYGDLFRTATLSTILATFNIEENRVGHGMIQFTTEMAFMMIERLMGGEGSPDQFIRELTDFEKIILMDIFQKFVDLYMKAMRNFMDISGRILQVETDEKVIPKAYPYDELFIKTTFELKFPKNRGFMMISVPLSALLDFLSTGKYKKEDQEEKKSYTIKDVPKEMVNELKFSAEVVLGSTVFKVRDLLEMKKGTVIVLDRNVNDMLEVYINKKPRFTVKPGYVNNKMGALVTSIIVEENNQDEQ